MILARAFNSAKASGRALSEKNTVSHSKNQTYVWDVPCGGILGGDGVRHRG